MINTVPPQNKKSLFIMYISYRRGIVKYYDIMI